MRVQEIDTPHYERVPKDLSPFASQRVECGGNCDGAMTSYFRTPYGQRPILLMLVEERARPSKEQQQLMLIARAEKRGL